MKRALTLRTVMVLTFPSLFTGCISIDAPSSQTELLAYLMEGYTDSYPGVYYDNHPTQGPQSSRLAALLVSLGEYDYYGGGVSVRENGTELWFHRSLKYYRGDNNEYLVIGTDGAPETLSFAKSAVIRNRIEIAHRIVCESGEYAIQLANGPRILCSQPLCFADDMSFFCKAYEKYEPARMTVDPAFVYLYPVKDPNRPVYASKLKYLPDVMLRIGPELYMIAKDDKRPTGLHIEICSLDGGIPSTSRELRIPCPRLLFAERLEFADFDPVQNRLLVNVRKSWPYRSEAFIYNIEHAALTKLKKRKDGSPLFFLDSAVLANAVRHANLKNR